MSTGRLIPRVPTRLPASLQTQLPAPGSRHRHLETTAAPKAPVAKGAQVANIVVTAGGQTETLPLKTDTAFYRPGLKWRLLRH